MLLGILVPTVILCIGTKTALMGMFSLILPKHKLRNSDRMTKIVMPVCFPHIDGGNYLRSPASILRLPPCIFMLTNHLIVI